MKKQWIIPFILGLTLGGVGVYFGLRGMTGSSTSAQVFSEHTTTTQENSIGTATDPFESDGYGLILTDQNDVGQRHMCIALWYAEYSVERFGRAIGHEFGPIWNQRHPVEILEEHLEFMKKFMADTERLEKQTKIDSHEDK